MKDNRDPQALGAAVLVLAELHGSARKALDRSTFRTIPHTADPGPIEKYGDPRLIPSTMPNAAE